MSKGNVLHTLDAHLSTSEGARARGISPERGINTPYYIYKCINSLM